MPSLSAGSLIGSLIFGAIGFSAFIYGKKQSSWKPMAIGIALMVYPYVVTQTLPMILVGIALVAARYIFR